MAAAAVLPAIRPLDSRGVFSPAMFPGLGLPLELQNLEIASRTYVPLITIRSEA
jgi:hypothetical protein